MYLESTARLAFLTSLCAIKAIQLKPECYLSSVICLPKVKVLYGSFFFLFLYCFVFKNLHCECFLTFSFLKLISFRSGFLAKSICLVFDVFFVPFCLFRISNGGFF